MAAPILQLDGNELPQTHSAPNRPQMLRKRADSFRAYGTDFSNIPVIGSSSQNLAVDVLEESKEEKVSHLRELRALLKLKKQHAASGDTMSVDVPLSAIVNPEGTVIEKAAARLASTPRRTTASVGSVMRSIAGQLNEAKKLVQYADSSQRKRMQDLIDLLERLIVEQQELVDQANMKKKSYERREKRLSAELKRLQDQLEGKSDKMEMARKDVDKVDLYMIQLKDLSSTIRGKIQTLRDECSRVNQESEAVKEFQAKLRQENLELEINSVDNDPVIKEWKTKIQGVAEMIDQKKHEMEQLATRQNEMNMECKSLFLQLDFQEQERDHISSMIGIAKRENKRLRALVTKGPLRVTPVPAPSSRQEYYSAQHNHLGDDDCDEYKSEIKELTSQVEDSKSRLRELRQEYMRYAKCRAEVQTYLRSCLDDVRHEMIEYCQDQIDYEPEAGAGQKKRYTAINPKRQAAFVQAEFEKSIEFEQARQQEKIIRALYSKAFPQPASYNFMVRNADDVDDVMSTLLLQDD